MLPVRDSCRPSLGRRPRGHPPSAGYSGQISHRSAAYPRAMEALVERLSQLDSHAEGAIRVVMFYDTLMRRRVDLPPPAPAPARPAAGLAVIPAPRPVR